MFTDVMISALRRTLVAKREMEEAEKELKGVTRATEELYKRYNECDSQGHRELDKVRRYCDYCYRPTKFSTPALKNIQKMKKNEKKYTLATPNNLPFIIGLEKKALDEAQEEIFYKGINKIREELKI